MVIERREVMGELSVLEEKKFKPTMGVISG